MGKFVLEAKFCVTAIVVSEHDQRNIKPVLKILV
jgi:hypothetical protein